jgi:hypothetical protein
MLTGLQLFLFVQNPGGLTLFFCGAAYQKDEFSVQYSQKSMTPGFLPGLVSNQICRFAQLVS